MEKISFISIKKLVALLILAIMVITPVTSQAAFSFWPFWNNDHANTAVDNKYGDIEDYKSFLNDSKSYLKGIDRNMSIDEMKNAIFDKIMELQENYSDTSAIPYISNKILNETHILDDYIFVCYDTLHTLGTEYLVEDITEYAKEKGAAI